MTQSDQVSAIVRGLSEAGRNAVQYGAGKPGEDGKVRIFANRGTMGSLQRLGLIEDDGGYTPRIGIFTPLGLAIHNHLLAQGPNQ